MGYIELRPSSLFSRNPLRKFHLSSLSGLNLVERSISYGKFSQVTEGSRETGGNDFQKREKSSMRRLMVYRKQSMIS